MENAKPQDLALLVHRKLKLTKHQFSLPEIHVLEDLFDCLFYTSMCKEESDLVKVTITFIDPLNPDPSPPSDVAPDRWGCVRFAEVIRLNTQSLVKLFNAADPCSTTIAVYFDEHGLYIWGMIDQAMHYQNFLNYESERGSEQPGLFQVAINDIGTLNVLFDYELLATLKQNTLVQRYLDVLTIGPVSRILRKNAESLKAEFRQYIEEHHPDEKFDAWEVFLDNLWIQAFSRLLLKIQNYQHGGAILITEDKNDLDTKYMIHYERLRTAMISHAKAAVDFQVLRTLISGNFSKGKKTVSKQNYFAQTAAYYQKTGTADEISGALSFIASQSCVDGVVLFDKRMVANGFGTVLRSKRMPRQIYVAATSTAVNKSLTSADPTHYGTRHRSMIAYCWSHPGALGMVISQDGEIRAFSRIEGKLIMWENIKTQQYLKN